MVCLRVVSRCSCVLALLLVACGASVNGESEAERCGSDAEGDRLEANDCIGSRITGSVADGADDNDLFVWTVPSSGTWFFELSWAGGGDLDFYVDRTDGTPGQFEEVASGASETDNPESDQAVLTGGEEVDIIISAFDTNFEEREYVFTFTQ